MVHSVTTHYLAAQELQGVPAATMRMIRNCDWEKGRRSEMTGTGALDAVLYTSKRLRTKPPWRGRLSA